MALGRVVPCVAPSLPAERERGESKERSRSFAVCVKSLANPILDVFLIVITILTQFFCQK